VARVSEEYDVVCPHCKKEFRAEPIEGETPAQRGFKCPHCKLFAPFERVEQPAPDSGAAPQLG
jgi:DNA-directed RNA polymerase subunit RPC12/RpoP